MRRPVITLTTDLGGGANAQNDAFHRAAEVIGQAEIGSQGDDRTTHWLNYESVERYYFDHNATTPVSPEVIQAMMSCLSEVYGNASSIHHFGQMAKQRLELARRQTAALIGCQPPEIVFVSGGTEADNLALFGVVRHLNRPQKHVVTTVIEHPAVLNACAQLEQEGVAVTYVRVGASGVVEPDDVRRAALDY